MLEEWRFKEPFAKDESITGDLIAAGSLPKSAKMENLPKIPDIIKITYFWQLLEEWRFKEPFAKNESTEGDLITAWSLPKSAKMAKPVKNTRYHENYLLLSIARRITF